MVPIVFLNIFILAELLNLNKIKDVIMRGEHLSTPGPDSHTGVSPRPWCPMVWDIVLVLVIVSHFYDVE